MAERTILITSVMVSAQCNNYSRTEAKNAAGELARTRNQIFSSLLNTYEKLKKLGFIYYNGKVSFIDITEEENE